jgi:hypothetical protein
MKIQGEIVHCRSEIQKIDTLIKYIDTQIARAKRNRESEATIKRLKSNKSDAENHRQWWRANLSFHQGQRAKHILKQESIEDFAVRVRRKQSKSHIARVILEDVPDDPSVELPIYPDNGKVSADLIDDVIDMSVDGSEIIEEPGYAIYSIKSKPLLVHIAEREREQEGKNSTEDPIEIKNHDSSVRFVPPRSSSIHSRQDHSRHDHLKRNLETPVPLPRIQSRFIRRTNNMKQRDEKLLARADVSKFSKEVEEMLPKPQFDPELNIDFDDTLRHLKENYEAKPLPEKPGPKLRYRLKERRPLYRQFMDFFST